MRQVLSCNPAEKKSSDFPLKIQASKKVKTESEAGELQINQKRNLSAPPAKLYGEPIMMVPVYGYMNQPIMQPQMSTPVMGMGPS